MKVLVMALALGISAPAAYAVDPNEDDVAVFLGGTVNTNFDLGLFTQVCKKDFCGYYTTNDHTVGLGYNVANNRPNDNEFNWFLQPGVGYSVSENAPVLSLYGAASYEIDQDYSPEVGVYFNSAGNTFGVAGARLQDVETRF